MWIATAAQCREMDRAATAEFGIPVRVLMERAGLAVFEALQQLLPHGRVGILCGKGNNGGDGFVVARFAEEARFAVDCLVAAREDELTPEAAEQLHVARAQGVRPIFADEPRFEKALNCLRSCDVIVDALLGTGASGEIKDPILTAIQAINQSAVPVISIDIPSGIDCDTGEELGESVWALRTITFGRPKPFLFQGIGLEHSGYWTVADIGFPSALLRQPTMAEITCGEWVGHLLPERLKASHKGENGTVLIVAGSESMPGAATLAAKAALRSGAGLIIVASIRSVCQAVSSHVPEALVVHLPERFGVISPDAEDTLLSLQDRANAALFGPGLTHNEPIIELLGSVWSNWRLPCVIDADALNAVSKGVPLPNCPSVLTPHPGEMARLLETTTAEIQADRFRSVREAIEKFNTSVILKGPYSISGGPREPMTVNCTGNPGMASGGMGDVLSGVITTLLAQDLPAQSAAICGMFWHGLAGDLCAEAIGAIGYSARDVATRLPMARAKIVSKCDQKPC